MVLAALTVGLVAAGIPARYDELIEFTVDNERSFRDLGISDDFYARYVSALGVAVAVTHLLIAAVITWLRPREWMALFVSLALVTNGAVNPLSPVHPLAVAHPSVDPAVDLLIYLGIVSSVSLLYLFPNGRFVPPWTLPLAIVWSVLSVPAIFFANAGVSFTTWPLVFPVLILVGWAGSGVFAQVYRYLNVSSPVQRQQAKWAVLGLTAAVVGPFAYFLPFVIIPSLSDGGTSNLFYQRLGSEYFTLALLFRLVSLGVFALALVIFPLFLAIAILRYRLWDIGVVVNRTLVYGGMTSSLVVIYFGSVVLLQLAFKEITDRGGPLAIVISTLAIAALFQPVRRRAQGFIDRRFYRRKYDAAQTVAAFSARLRDEVDLSRLSQELVEVVEETMEPDHVSLWLREPGRQIVGGDGGAPQAADAPVVAWPRQPAVEAVEIAPNDPVVAYFQGAEGVVEIDKLHLDSAGVGALREAGVKMVVPLVSQGELVGLLNLGSRLSQQEYSTDDHKLLTDLATQAAPAVWVAQLVRQQQDEAQARERIEQELRIARFIQQTLLPKDVPTIKGWHLAAHYQPAREVGGDFYDFFDLPGGRLGLVVGDVTDKGVPAALIMATTRTIVRSAAERFASPGQVLQRANDLILPDIPANMFVTCLYAVLDPASGRLQYANAGHDLPYLRCGRGVEEFRATGMPLGLMPGMTYEEKEIEMVPGECVLLYSDGLVEAHNPQREMFGFPRLQEMMTKHPGGASLIEFLLGELKEFTGAGWEQEDDVTLVTLQCDPAVGAGCGHC